jgi:predicted ATPase
MIEGKNSPRRNNLPTPLSVFIGQEQELASLKQLLSENRLVTLTGAGGSGKTWLAIKLAKILLDIFEQGIWLIEFASLVDAKLVPQVVATTLRMRERKNFLPLDDRIKHLQNHSLFLIFDNCEHLIKACAQLAEKLLVACPRLRILATSREDGWLPLAGVPEHKLED